MKLKSAIIMAAGLSLVAGGAMAADNSKSQRYNKNSEHKATKVSKKSSEDFSRIVDLNYEKKQYNQRHPVHQKRMGDH